LLVEVGGRRAAFDAIAMIMDEYNDELAASVDASAIQTEAKRGASGAVSWFARDCRRQVNTKLAESPCGAANGHHAPCRNADDDGDAWRPTTARCAGPCSARKRPARAGRCGSSSTVLPQQHRLVRLCRFFSCLPSRVRSLSDVTIDQIDAFLAGEAERGWRRTSLHSLGSSLRSFFRFAAQQGWCSGSLALDIDLPRRYELGDVPRAPSVDEIDQLLAITAMGDDTVTIRDHAILLLLIHYGLRRGEVERLMLDDVDWVAETLQVMRPKLRRPHRYPLSAPVGEAILRYLREARPRCEHRTVFITVNAPFRPLSGSSISAMVRKRLRKQGVKLEWSGAHCLRHACAGQLLDAGFTLKQIADHLGHRSMSSTRIYTKIDLRGLRQVAELDLGGLL
jgi:site-specific recombinase XerD